MVIISHDQELNKNKSNNKFNKKKKLPFKDAYELKILLKKIEKKEKELLQLQILLLKKNLSLAEDQWLQLQIRNDEISKQ